MRLETISVLNKTESDVLIHKVEEKDYTIIRDFIINNDIEMKDVVLSTSFVLYTTDNNNPNLCAVFCFEKNDIRTKFSFPPDKEERNYNELIYILIDKTLLKKDIFVNIFSKLLTLIVSNDKHDEVIWIEYNGLKSRLIENAFKTCNEYYFENESQYFAKQIIDGYNFVISKKKRIRDCINTNKEE